MEIGKRYNDAFDSIRGLKEFVESQQDFYESRIDELTTELEQINNKDMDDLD